MLGVHNTLGNSGTIWTGSFTIVGSPVSGAPQLILSGGSGIQGVLQLIDGGSGRTYTINCGTPHSGSLSIADASISANRLELNTAGTWNFFAPSSINVNGVIVNGSAGGYSLAVNASTSLGNSYGALVAGGSNSGDVAFNVVNAAVSSTFFKIRGDGVMLAPLSIPLSNTACVQTVYSVIAQTTRSTTSTASVTDPDIQLTVNETGWYAVEGSVYFNGTTTGTQGFNYNFFSGGTAVMSQARIHGTGTVNGGLLTFQAGSSLNNNFNFGTISVSPIADVLNITGFVQITTPGTITAEYNASSVTANNVNRLVGSRLMLKKVG